jgi:hypothetical protein
MNAADNWHVSGWGIRRFVVTGDGRVQIHHKKQADKSTYPSWM